MEVGKEFNDQKGYNNSMGKAVDDKLFFLDKLKLEQFIVVDFGCADGTVLQELERRFPRNILNRDDIHCYIGFDISKSMIDMAKEKWDGESKDVLFTDNWPEVIAKVETIKHNRMNADKLKVYVLLSSVLHEIYSYGTSDTIQIAWDRIFGLDADYIIFRDMMWSDTDKNADIKWYAKTVLASDEYKDLRTSFENKWGVLFNPKNLTHFLLKYRWRINWEREVSENYFPISLSQFLEKMTKQYEPDYLERVSLPFIQKQWGRDFNFSSFPIKTHLKAIFRKKN